MINFATHFKRMLIFCSIGGFYIPGAELLLFGKKTKFLLTYAIVYNICILSDSVDWLLTSIIYFKVKPAIEVFYLLMVCFMYVWAVINSLYFVVNRKDVHDMIELWNSLDARLWPEIRLQLINEAYKLTKVKYVKMVVCLCFPYVIQLIHHLWEGSLFMSSLWAYKEDSWQAPRYGILFTGIPVVLFQFGYCTYTSFFTLIQRIILAELSYLKTCLVKVMSLQTVPFDNEVDAEQAKTVRSMLNMWISYHIKLLKFGKQVKVVYSPLVLFQFFFLTTTLCSICFCASTGIMPFATSVITFLFVGFFSFINLLSCRLGDIIYNKSYTLGECGFHGDWMAFPKDIQRDLKMIILISKYKPLVIVDSAGLYPLTSVTYLQLTMLEYKFVRFVADMRVK